MYDGAAAESRLRRLGILRGTKPLVEALRDGASGARATTRLHPAPYRGQRMWGETHASLCQYESADGFKPLNHDGVHLVVQPDRGVALLVTAGDACAGAEKYFPQVRYERRTVIQGLVNGRPPTLFDHGQPPPWEIWFLLHHLNKDSVQAELSRPRSVTESGMVTGWSERILLPEIGFSDPTRVGDPMDNIPAEVEIDVQRRGS